MLVGMSAFFWTTAVLVAVFTATSLYLRRQMVHLRCRQVKLEAMVENQDARLFMIEQEQRWLAAHSNEISELQS